MLSKKRISYQCEDGIKKNPFLAIAVHHHLANFVMPNHDPWKGFFYFTLILMIDYYNLIFLFQISKEHRHMRIVCDPVMLAHRSIKYTFRQEHEQEHAPFA